MVKKGYKNEFDFIRAIDKKHFYELNPLFQELIETLYPNVSLNDTIIAYKYGSYAKVDMVIEIKGVKKGISIKSGAKNSVHIETIASLVNFLKKYDFKEEDKLLRYLYSDGTNNNTGVKRESIEEYREKHLDDIALINRELNRLKKLLIERFLIKTNINYKVIVDAFIKGTPEGFLWATKQEVINYLMNSDLISSSIHISNLFIQEWNKNLNYNLKYEFCRDYVQVKWYSLFDDFIKIMCIRENK